MTPRRRGRDRFDALRVVELEVAGKAIDARASLLGHEGAGGARRRRGHGRRALRRRRPELFRNTIK